MATEALCALDLTALSDHETAADISTLRDQPSRSGDGRRAGATVADVNALLGVREITADRAGLLAVGSEEVAAEPCSPGL